MTIGNCNVVTLKTPICTTISQTKNWKHSVINERLSIPYSMPNIKAIQSVSTNIKINSTDFILTPDSNYIANGEGTYLTGVKLVVSGEIEETITYESTLSCKLYSFNHNEPFTTFIVLDPSFDINSEICLKSCIEGVLVQKIDCRQIQKNIAIFLTLN